MTRLQALNPETTTGKTKELFNAVQSKLGSVPNMMRTMGNADAVLEGYLNLSGALAKGKLGGKTGELIALAVGESNQCHYCIAAHTYYNRKIEKSRFSKPKVYNYCGFWLLKWQNGSKSMPTNAPRFRFHQLGSPSAPWNLFRQFKIHLNSL